MLFRCYFFTLFFFLFSCNLFSSSVSSYVLRGSTMGTSYSIKFISEKKITNYELFLVKKDLDKALVSLNKQMSTFMKNSSISSFNELKNSEFFETEKEFSFVVKNAIKLWFLTGGSFDITSDPLINLWGFDRSGRRITVPTDTEINKAKTFIGVDKFFQNGHRLLKLCPDLKINLSGIAKGFGVDFLYKIVKKKGFSDFVIEIGGETRALGLNKSGSPWRIAIINPFEQTKDALNFCIKLQDLSLATSGIYLNFFENYRGEKLSHIIDPRTGKPVPWRLVSASVTAPSCILADALATSAFVNGEKKSRFILSKLKNASAFFVYLDSCGKIRFSFTNNFPFEENFKS